MSDSTGEQIASVEEEQTTSVGLDVKPGEQREVIQNYYPSHVARDYVVNNHYYDSTGEQIASVEEEQTTSVSLDVKPGEQREVIQNHYPSHVARDYVVNNFYYGISHSRAESTWNPSSGPGIMSSYVLAAPETAERVLGIVEQEQEIERKAGQAQRRSATVGFVFSNAVVIGLATLAIVVAATSGSSSSRWTAYIVGIISGAVAPAAISIITRAWLRTIGSVTGERTYGQGEHV
jgi:hypothetical protein